MHDFSLGGSLGDWLVHIMGPAHLALQLGTVSPTSIECVTKEPLNKWLWPWRAHTIIEFPKRAGMPPVTVHLYQNMRGEFKNPPGMAENEPLFPRPNNLAEKGRPFVDAGDGVMAVGEQITIDGKRVATRARRHARRDARRHGRRGDVLNLLRHPPRSLAGDPWK